MPLWKFDKDFGYLVIRQYPGGAITTEFILKPEYQKARDAAGAAALVIKEGKQRGQQT
jgi:hypothetical protein